MKKGAVRSFLLAGLMLAGLFAVPASAQQAPVGEAAPAGAWYSFTASVAGQQLVFPLAAGTPEVLGWKALANPSERLAPQQYANVPYNTGAGTIALRLANPGDTTLPLAECTAVGLLWDGGEHSAEVALPGGVGAGTARADILAAWGEPTGEEAGSLHYQASRYASITLALENDAVAGITLVCTKAGAAVPDLLPAEAAAYTAPAELGGEPWSYNIAYDGQLYTLPAPAAAFINNGWQLYDEGTIPAGGFLTGATLCLGPLRLRTALYNYAATAQPLAACWVVMVESSERSMALPLTLAGGLTETSSYIEALALLGPPAEDTSDLNSRSLTWYGENGHLVLRFSPDEALRPLDFEVWHLGL